MPGLAEMVRELNSFLQMEQAPKKVERQPDYIIVAPDFVPNSAGIICLYQICADLKKIGFEVAVTSSQRRNPNFPIPLLSTREAMKAAKSGSWVIYPEMVEGNPLKAVHIARWVLNRPGLLGGDEVYSDEEHVFVYSNVFAPYVKNEIRGRLYMPTIDRSIFFPPTTPQERTLECYYVGKSRYQSGYFDPNLTFEITRTSPPKSELGKLFRSSRVLYCFDNSTILAYEAILCGCPVIIIPDGTQTWEDYKTLELGTAGLHWGTSGGKPKPFEPIELQATLGKWEMEYKKELAFFVNYTQTIHPSTIVRSHNLSPTIKTDRTDPPSP
jgi:hypothetical protein